MGAARMDNLSAGEVGGIFAGVIAVLAAAGKGLAWLLNWNNERTEAKQKRLDAWEESLARREREYREGIETELAELKGEMMRLRTQQGALSFSLLEVAIAHRNKDPESPALARAAAALKQAFPPEFGFPPEIAELIHALETKVSEGRSQR